MRLQAWYSRRSLPALEIVIVVWKKCDVFQGCCSPVIESIASEIRKSSRWCCSNFFQQLRVMVQHLEQLHQC